MLKILFAALIFMFESGSLFAQEAVFTPSPADRILVIAPHPDDEVLGVGGILQRAKESGADVRVLYLTNGESNEVSSIFYQKRPLLLKSDFVKNGTIRKNEAVASMNSLGFPLERLIFFGYPDGGMMNVWLKYWGAVKPFRSIFTRINKVPYKDAYSYGKAYRGQEIVQDMERVMLAYLPTEVFVTAPFDLNHDHQAAYLFTKVVLLNLREQLNPKPKLRLYVIHAHRWPSPKKFQPKSDLAAPGHIRWEGQVQWERFPLSYEETMKKNAAILLHKSQVAYKRAFLTSFSRANEIYADYADEPVPYYADESTEPFQDAPEPGNVRLAVYRKDLWVEVPITGMLDEMGSLSLYLFSYRSGFLFSDMPKFSFKLFGNKLFAYKNGQNFHDKNLVYRFDKDKMMVRLPLEYLKDPDYLFVSSRNVQEDLSLDFGTWRALKIPENRS